MISKFPDRMPEYLARLKGLIIVTVSSSPKSIAPEGGNETKVLIIRFID